MNFEILIMKNLYRYERQSQYLVFNPVIISYQYYDLVDLLIKKKRSRMDQSLYTDPWFPQSMNNTKDEKINLGKEYDNEKQDNNSTTNDMNISSVIV